MTELNAQQFERLATQSFKGDASAANKLVEHAGDVLTNPNLMRELQQFNPTHDPLLPSFTLVDDHMNPLKPEELSDPNKKPAGLEIFEGSDHQDVSFNGRFGVSYDDALAPAVLNTTYRDFESPKYDPKVPTIGK
jgi:hypothetical protein